MQAGSVSNDTYDYFMTLDSDTFVRFSPLARRLSQLYGEKKINPRQEPLLIGRIGYHLTYFLPTVPDGNKDEQEEDEYVKGPWFPYPIGIGYMLRYARPKYDVQLWRILIHCTLYFNYLVLRW